MNTRFEWGGEEGTVYLNKVALAHFDPPDLLKLNYSDLWSLEHEAAEAAVYSGALKKCNALPLCDENNENNNVFSFWQKRTKRTISRHHDPEVIEYYYKRFCVTL